MPIVSRLDHLPTNLGSRFYASFRSWLPWIIAGILCLLFTGFLTWRIQRDLLTENDELLTAERSREMLLSGSPWTVCFNFQPSFNKPPLQYWCVAATLSRWHNRELAVRFWSLIHAVAALVATGWLASVLDRQRPWLIPLSMALLLTFQSFMHEVGTARLDVGLMCFVTMVIGAVLCAHWRPPGIRWLVAATLACSLASLQKNPLGLLCWLLLIVTWKILRPTASAHPADNFSRWEVGCFAIACLVSILWPLLQIVGYGMPLAQTFGYAEAAVVTGPTRLGALPYLYLFKRLTGYWMWGAFVLLAAVWQLARRIILRGRPQSAVSVRAAELSFLCLAIITLATLAGFRSVRYILPLSSCFCVLAAFGLHRILEFRSRWVRFPVGALSVILFGVDLHHVRSNCVLLPVDVSPQHRSAIALGTVMRRASPQTRCLIVRHDEEVGSTLHGSFYLFYGNLGVTVRDLVLRQVQPVELSPPAAGVCERRDFAFLQQLSPGLTVRAEHGGFVCWETAGTP